MKVCLFRLSPIFWGGSRITCNRSFYGALARQRSRIDRATQRFLRTLDRLRVPGFSLWDAMMRTFLVRRGVLAW